MMFYLFRNKVMDNVVKLNDVIGDRIKLRRKK